MPITIKEPEVEIYYSPTYVSWLIKVDGQILKGQKPGVSMLGYIDTPIKFGSKTAALDWAKSRDLLNEQ